MIKRLHTSKLVAVLLIAFLALCSTSFADSDSDSDSDSNSQISIVIKARNSIKAFKRSSRFWKIKCHTKSYRSELFNPRSRKCGRADYRLVNYWKRALHLNIARKDTDSDGLSDYAELVIYMTNARRADTDGDGYKDGDEVLSGTNPSDSTDHPQGTNTCTVPTNVFDVNGNTTSFGIPSGFTGNITAGQTFWNTRCAACHAGGKDSRTFSQISSSVPAPPMNITNVTTQQYADLAAYLNRNYVAPTPNPNCVLTPTPTPTINYGGGGGTTPTPTPTSTPGGACTPRPDPFDANGNTISFSIPSGISGNITTGQTRYASSCFNCHGADRGTGYDYPRLFAAVNGAPMFLSSLTQQNVADLTAYLNRADHGNNCSSPTPTPTATPSDTEKGRLVYVAACSTCHRNAKSLASESSSVKKIKDAIREVRQMRSIVLTEEQLRVLVVYFRSL